MKRIRVNFILVLVVVSMLALLFIQAFQTAQLYDRKSTEFSKRFSTTLERVSLRHEKAEDIRRYMHVIDRDFSGRYKDVLKEEFQSMLSSQESISIRDTTIYKDGKSENYLVIRGMTYDSISGLTAQQEVLARDVRKLRDLFQTGDKDISKDSLDLAIKLDQRVIQQIFKKARFVNDIMVEAFRNNLYQDPNQRIDVVFLDSVLKVEFQGDKLPKSYQFAITDEHNMPIDFKRKTTNYSMDLDTTHSHATLLFPSNSLDEDLYLHVWFPKQRSFLYREMWGQLAVNLGLVGLIVIALIFMFRTILTQRKLSEMKNDFISNMTHEFKTPISTISLACQAMNDSDMTTGDASSVQPYVKMINDENQRLSLLVERILQSATLDRGELKLRPEPILLNELIHDIKSNAQFRVSNSGGNVTLDLPVELIEVEGDRMHVTNLVSNLVDNAIKYGGHSPEVHISLKREGKRLILSVTDKGIGIKKEHLSKIFDKLYRIPTGNIHNVKGFGLGLSYVKAIADLHGWQVSVKSKFGVGSEFTVVIKE